MWPLTYISEANFKEHVRKTIESYGKKLEPYDLERFNKNIVDPIKMMFDQSVYKLTWEEVVKSEIFRQRDKSNNNDIGYFHQHIFKYIANCTVPTAGWDVIVDIPNGLKLPEGDVVHKVYVEMKNKHNTMNSASSGKTYIKMQNQLLKDDDCVCFLVEAIAKESQNIIWRTMVDGSKVSHRRIRRVSLDQLYEIATGQPDAFHQMCMLLPEVIESSVGEGEISIPKDSVYNELKRITEEQNISFTMAVCLLAFSTYKGF